MTEFKLKEMVVCKCCELICDGDCSKTLFDEKNDYIGGENTPLKIKVECLGKFCDKPCEYQQKENYLSLDDAVKMIKFLGTTVNKLLTKDA